MSAPLRRAEPGSRRRARAQARRRPAGTSPTSWQEGDCGALGSRVEPAALAVLEACGVASGGTLLDLTAGDGCLAELAAASGVGVTAIEPDPRLLAAGRRRRLETPGRIDWHAACSRRAAARGAFDAVVSNFTASHDPDQRRVARTMMRAAAPGAPIALSAWKGLMASVMSITAPERAGRSEHWSRHEAARLHFGDRRELSVRAHSMRWRFEDADDAVSVLVAPAGGESARRRLRAAMPDLIEMYGLRCREGLELRSDFAVVLARGA